MTWNDDESQQQQTRSHDENWEENSQEKQLSRKDKLKETSPQNIGRGTAREAEGKQGEYTQ